MVPVLASLVLLGPADLTTPPLASFTCELQQCAVDGNTWDLDSCTPGTGCGCTTDSPTPLLALAPLLLFRRRTAR